jgi:hypothetical protein
MKKVYVRCFEPKSTAIPTTNDNCILSTRMSKASSHPHCNNVLLLPHSIQPNSSPGSVGLTISFANHAATASTHSTSMSTSYSSSPLLLTNKRTSGSFSHSTALCKRGLHRSLVALASGSSAPRLLIRCSTSKVATFVYTSCEISGSMSQMRLLQSSMRRRRVNCWLSMAALMSLTSMVTSASRSLGVVSDS